jgi:hypothetical protein
MTESAAYLLVGGMLAATGALLVILRARIGPPSDRVRKAMWPENERHKRLNISGSTASRDAGIVLALGGLAIAAYGLFAK